VASEEKDGLQPVHRQNEWQDHQDRV